MWPSVIRLTNVPPVFLIRDGNTLTNPIAVNARTPTLRGYERPKYQECVLHWRGKERKLIFILYIRTAVTVLLLLWLTSWPEAAWEGNGLFQLTAPGHTPSLRKLGRSLRQRPWKSSPPWLAQEQTLTERRTTDPRVIPLTLIISQENAPESCLQASLIETIVSQLTSLFLSAPNVGRAGWPIKQNWNKNSTHAKLRYV